MNPLVSVIVPTYNSEQFLEKCLASIRAQTHAHLELIVVDEQSNDHTMAIAQRYAHAIYSGGPERSIKRNIGIEKAQGDFVYVVDSDMELHPRVVEECVKIMADSLVGSVVTPEISQGEGFWAMCVAFDRAFRLQEKEPGIAEAARFFRRADIRAAGGYDPTIVGAEDWDLHNRMKRFGRCGKGQSPIYHHEGRVSLYKRVRKKYYYSRAFREYIRRYPRMATQQFSPFKLAYVKGYRDFLKHPILGMGVMILKNAEAFAGFVGLIFQHS